MNTLTHTGTRATRRLASLAAGAIVAVAALVGASLPAEAANPYERGPAPTERSIEARTGPFATSSTRVSSLSVRGFGGGTIYYPTTTSEGTFGAVAVSPGYTASQSSMSWLGPRLASQGFVIFTIDTNSRYDQPGSRADQLQAALDYLVEDSSVRSRIDADRLAVMGHSMGGGGSLEASNDNSRLKASIPLTPWHTTKRWGSNSVPQLIIGASSDTVAAPRSHAIPFYESLPSSTSRVYLEVSGSHFAPNTSNTTIAKYSIAWLKRFVDEDTRYSQFLTGRQSGTDIRDWRSGGAL